MRVVLVTISLRCLTGTMFLSLPDRYVYLYILSLLSIWVGSAMSEWDPWKRFERKRERRLWDPFARLEYERDRLSWDPYYRMEKEMTDPFYRLEKHRDDPEVRMRRYEERRNSSEWLELYYENPLDPVLRRRYEALFRSAENDEAVRTLRLFESVSRVNRMYDRGFGYWANLILKIGMLGFLIWFLWGLLSWRPFMP